MKESRSNQEVYGFLKSREAKEDVIKENSSLFKKNIKISKSYCLEKERRDIDD